MSSGPATAVPPPGVLLQQALALDVRRDRAVRLGVVVKMLIAAGYAMIGGAFTKVIADGEAFTTARLIWAAAGALPLAFAIVYAPRDCSS